MAIDVIVWSNCAGTGAANALSFFFTKFTPYIKNFSQKETNKSEQFNRFLKWLAFGSAGVIRENDRAAQQKALKYNLLLANAMIFYNTVMLSKDLRTLIKQGYYVDPVCVAVLSPYATKDLERFGKYTLNLARVPDPVDYGTPVISQLPLGEADSSETQTFSEQREV